VRTAQSPKRALMEFLPTAYDAAADRRPMGSFRAGIDGRPRTTAIGAISHLRPLCAVTCTQIVCSDGSPRGPGASRDRLRLEKFLVLSPFRHRLGPRRTPEPHWKDFYPWPNIQVSRSSKTAPPRR
jgi:hypothetical protein